MRFAWLNIVLLLTNKIYQRKQQVIEMEGMRVIGNVFILLCLEILLALISLPLYLTLRSQKVIAYLQEKGIYEKIIFDFKLRRILTLTGTGIVLVIWFVKLLIILFVPSFVSPLELFTVSELRPQAFPTVSSELALAQSDLRSAVVSSNLPVPELTEVRKHLGKNYIFRGTGKPDATIFLLLTDDQTAIYSGTVQTDGTWLIEHLQKDFTLHEGNHSVLAFIYDESSKSRSELSSEQFINVQTSLLDLVTRNVDTLANWSVVIVISVGVLLTFLTL